MVDYVISTVRPAAGGNVVFEVYTSEYQRLYVAMPSRRTDAASVDATIRHTIAALAAPPLPSH